jgi:hypothetical protein
LEVYISSTIAGPGDFEIPPENLLANTIYMRGGRGEGVSLEHYLPQIGKQGEIVFDLIHHQLRVAHPEFSSFHKRHVSAKCTPAETPPAGNESNKGKPFARVPVPLGVYVVPGWEWEFVYIKIGSGGSVNHLSF